jgi:hypothetical protein
MREVDSTEYNAFEFDNYFNKTEHYNFIHLTDEGKIDAFGCIFVHEGDYVFGYSWSDGTFSGKKSYIKGIQWLVNTFGIIYTTSTTKELNILKRGNDKLHVRV